MTADWLAVMSDDNLGICEREVLIKRRGDANADWPRLGLLIESGFT
jgi:hypothetical protein